jgi:malonate-semialdehyde dehydrogenase (acetylating) / methylmalonate-semialdehyde dehydrogenase
LIDTLGLPPGVVNLVNDAKDVVDAILDHPEIKAISFVGSTKVARYVYRRATANGKRAQCQGEVKNPIIVFADADLDTSVNIIADSAFGCAGQRCLAASLVVAVGDARYSFSEAIADAEAGCKVGYDLDDGIHTTRPGVD